MPIGKTILLYVLTAAFFLGVDMVWLGVIAKSFYQKQLTGLLGDRVNWSAALLFYLLFILGIILFVVLPAVEKGSIVQAVVYGALFGLFCYATYDLSNLATIKDWPLVVTIVDMIWGMFISALTSSVSFLIAGFIV
jgi:uncharacterized membrane protein